MTFVGVITFQVLACKGFFEIEKAVNAIVASTPYSSTCGTAKVRQVPPLVYFGLQWQLDDPNCA